MHVHMTDGCVQLPYPILVTERRGEFDLRIRELMLVVRAPSLRQGYVELIERAHEVLARVKAMDGLDELPPARGLPPLRALLPKTQLPLSRSARS